MRTASIGKRCSVVGAFFSFWSLLWMAPHACTTPDKESTEPKTEGGAAAGAAQNLDSEERKQLDEMRAEMEIGRNMAGRLLQYYGIYDNKRLKAYVNQVGSYVATQSDYPERRYMFEVITSDEVNAFACPGGYILLTTGSLRHARNEAELAAILGHEVAHVGKRHMFNTLKSMDKKDLDQAGKDSAARKDEPESLSVRRRPEPEMSETGQMLARYLASSTGIGVIAAAKAGMNIILEKGLGADLEFEADREGVKYAIRAGYDPEALEDFLCRLELHTKNRYSKKKCLAGRDKQKKEASSVVEKTHPAVPERVKEIDKVLAAVNAGEIVGATGTRRYQEIVSVLPAKARKGKSE